MGLLVGHVQELFENASYLDSEGPPTVESELPLSREVELGYSPRLWGDVECLS